MNIREILNILSEADAISFQAARKQLRPVEARLDQVILALNDPEIVETTQRMTDLAKEDATGVDRSSPTAGYYFKYLSTFLIKPPSGKIFLDVPVDNRLQYMHEFAVKHRSGASGTKFMPASSDWRPSHEDADRWSKRDYLHQSLGNDLIISSANIEKPSRSHLKVIK